ncbi:MAG: hypothetical protein AABX83_03245, partial [Nanoarchaeota archaeon]
FMIPPISHVFTFPYKKQHSSFSRSKNKSYFSPMLTPYLATRVAHFELIVRAFCKSTDILCNSCLWVFLPRLFI